MEPKAQKPKPFSPSKTRSRCRLLSASKTSATEPLSLGQETLWMP